jgi:hypothetical protein
LNKRGHSCAPENYEQMGPSPQNLIVIQHQTSAETA